MQNEEFEDIEEAENSFDFRDLLDISIILLILIFIGVLIWVGIIFKVDAYHCLEDPVLYYEQMKNLSCVCIPDNLGVGFYP